MLPAWPEPAREYRVRYAARETNGFALGQVQFVEVEPELWVANLIGQRGLRAEAGVPPIRYEAVRAGLRTVADYAADHAASVHLPRIGAGLAGGKWEEIASNVEQELVRRGIDVTVYDLA